MFYLAFFVLYIIKFILIISMCLLGNQKITDSSFKKLGPLCVDLRHVYLTDCQLITDTSLKCLAACRNLTVLNLADCVRYVTALLL